MTYDNNWDKFAEAIVRDNIFLDDKLHIENQFNRRFIVLKVKIENPICLIFPIKWNIDFLDIGRKPANIDYSYITIEGKEYWNEINKFSLTWWTGFDVGNYLVLSHGLEVDKNSSTDEIENKIIKEMI